MGLFWNRSISLGPYLQIQAYLRPPGSIDPPHPLKPSEHFLFIQHYDFVIRQLSIFERLGLAKSSKKPEHNKEQLDFEGRVFEIIRKPHRRRLSVSIHINGRARVIVARSTRNSEISDFLRENSSWVRRRFDEIEKQRSLHPPKKFINGEKLLFLGEEHELVVLNSPMNRPRIVRRDQCLVCFLPKNHTPELVRRTLLKFYEREARQLFKDRIDILSQKMGLYPTSLSFRSQKSRWGSCSSKGRISLNWRLLAAPSDVIDYVLIHELGHLRHADHSKNFWNLVKAHAPHFNDQKRWLRQNHFELDFLLTTSELHTP
jgi:predicted metal-dependent hydrolase